MLGDRIASGQSDSGATQMSENELGIRELHYFASLGRLSASLLHEISQPLTVAMLQLEAFDSSPDPGIRRIRQSVQRMRSYLDAARLQLIHDDQPTQFKIRPQIEQLKQVVLPLAMSARVTLQFDVLPDCVMTGSPTKFQHILSNLIINAIDAYRDDANSGLTRSVTVKITQNRSQIIIRVIDWGTGISQQQMSRIFQPFYSTKTVNGQGLGIGLSLVNEYVTVDFAGSIRVRSSKRGGTQFTVALPFKP